MIIYYLIISIYFFNFVFLHLFSSFFKKTKSEKECKSELLIIPPFHLFRHTFYHHQDYRPPTTVHHHHQHQVRVSATVTDHFLHQVSATDHHLHHHYIRHQDHTDYLLHLHRHYLRHQDHTDHHHLHHESQR